MRQLKVRDMYTSLLAENASDAAISEYLLPKYDLLKYGEKCEKSMLSNCYLNFWMNS